MAPLGHRRQVVLFLVAVILPFFVLVAISLRVIEQDRELAEKREADDQRRLINNIRQELLARLERIKLKEASSFEAMGGKELPAAYENTSVVFPGWIAGVCSRTGSISPDYSARIG